MKLPQEPAPRAVVRKLETALPDALLAASESCRQLMVEVRPHHIRAVMEFLRAEAELRFDFLADLTAVDRYPIEPRFEIVYQLLAFQRRERVRIKARVTSENPRIDSVVPLWPAAAMLEREVFDLFGVHFIGHPNLRRLLMPEDWEGHPLRKDYAVEGPR